jgi:hypothetical protein
MFNIAAATLVTLRDRTLLDTFEEILLSFIPILYCLVYAQFNRWSGGVMLIME